MLGFLYSRIITAVTAGSCSRKEETASIPCSRGPNFPFAVQPVRIQRGQPNGCLFKLGDLMPTVVRRPFNRPRNNDGI
jgi:hypothetical protein